MAMYFILFIVYIYIYILVPVEMSRLSIGIMILIPSIAILFYFLNTANKEDANKYYLNFSLLFLFGYIIVHFQYYFDYILGYIDDSYLFIWINPAIVTKSLFLSGSGLLSFLIGYNLFERRKLVNFVVKPNAVDIEKSVTILKLISFILLTIYFFTVDPLYFLGFYGHIIFQPITEYSILIFQIITIVIIVQHNQNLFSRDVKNITFFTYLKTMGFSYIFLILIYLISVILSGDRGPVITFSLAFLGGYLYVTKRKLKIRYIIIILLIGSFFMSILGIARSLDKSYDFSDRIIDSMELFGIHSNSISPFTLELAGSVRTLHASVDYVPNNYPHSLGRFQLNQVISVIPFISSIIPDLDSEVKYRGTSSFITWIIQGDDPWSGTGTTMIADLYIDFSIFGVVVGMFLFGIFVLYSEKKMLSNSYESPYLQILILLYFSNSIYISRSSILFILKMVAWATIIFFINRHILNES